MSHQAVQVPRWSVALGAGLAVVSTSLPAHAQVLSTSNPAMWVHTTMASVAGVVGVWLTLAAGLSVARRMRWVTDHRHTRLFRHLQVVFGGLLLVAALVPYLAIHYPVVAVGLLAAAAVMGVVAGVRRPRQSSW